MVFSSVTQSPASFANLKPVITFPAEHFVDHIRCEACDLAIDLPCLASNFVFVSCMSATRLAQFTESVAGEETTSVAATLSFG